MYREFERSTTVAANAYLAPVMRRWFAGLRSDLAARGFTGEPLVMQSNGGLASMHGAAEIPAKLIRSGPSAGAVALEGLSRQIGGVERINRQLDILCEEKVFCVETAGASPEDIMPRLKEAGVSGN